MFKLNVTKVAHLSGHREAIYTLESAPGDTKIYSAGADGYVVKWDPFATADGQLVVKAGMPLYSLCMHPSGKKLFCGTSKGNLHVIDLDHYAEERNIEAHAGGIFDIRIYGTQLFTASEDGTVRTWNLDDLSLLQTIRVSEKSVRTMAISDHGLLAAGSSDHRIYLYEPGDRKLVSILHGHGNSVFALAFTRDNKTLLSGGRDAMLKAWDIDTSLLTQDIPAHLMQIKSIAFNPSYTFFATTSMDKTIKIWDARTCALLKVIDKARNESHSNCINKVIWLDETRFVTTGDDRAIILWQLEIL